jgi:hypothetical protein
MLLALGARLGLDRIVGLPISPEGDRPVGRA